MKKEWIEVPDDELNFYEEMLVALLGTLVPEGYNLKEGGSNGKPSKKTKQRMSKAQSGKIKSDVHKKKLSITLTGRTHTEETRKKLSEVQSGKTHTDETKKKISNAQLGDKNHNSKKVYQYDLDGTFVQSFESNEDAARSLNKKYGSLICRCARGTCKTAYGFKWSYTEL